MAATWRLPLVGVLILAACSSPAGSPSPSSSAEAGLPTCISSSDGPEVLCDLDVGTYQTAFLQPALKYAVPSAGWGSLNLETSPGNFSLFPPGGSLAGFEEGSTDDIQVVSAAVPPGLCNGEPSTEFPLTYEGLLTFLTTNPRLAVTNVHDATVAGWSGTVMDIAMVTGDGCPDGVFVDLFIGVGVSHGAWGIGEAQAGARLYLLHNPGDPRPLAVVVDDGAGGGSDYGDGEDWYGAAASVIDTFEFAP